MALLTELMATTRRNRNIESVADNIVAHNAILFTLKNRGHIKDIGGGQDIVEPLIYAQYDSETVKFFDGYDVFTVDTSQDVISASVWDWKELGGFTFISRAEERKNRGKHAVVNLLSAKRKALKSTLSNVTEIALGGDGSGYGGKAFSGLTEIVADSPSSAGTVGGIDQQANAFWRNQTNLAAATITASNILGKMNTLQLACTFGKDQPDLWLHGLLCFTSYWESLQANARHTSPKMADAGFRTLEFLGQPVVYVGTNAILTDRAYALNTDYLFFQTNGPMYEEQDEQQVQAGFYTLYPNYTMANLTTNNRSRHGVLGDST